MALDQFYYGDVSLQVDNGAFSVTLDVEMDSHGVLALAETSLAHIFFVGVGSFINLGVRQVRFFDFLGQMTAKDFSEEDLPPVMFAERMTGITFEASGFTLDWARARGSWHIFIFD